MKNKSLRNHNRYERRTETGHVLLPPASELAAQQGIPTQGNYLRKQFFVNFIGTLCTLCSNLY
jgi:hypothetical protein